ncbi:MAG: hypothetical protein LBH62_09695 [Nitrososphaerota archaeon]|jgi:hypothetical protein|nr:hypothetical protein [Nitrososphaerota archaeon]
MDLAENNCCWVELRPLITSKLESANFAPVLDALHSLGRPFRFFVVAPRDGSGYGGDERALVRFFLQFSDEPTRVQMTNIIRTLLDVEVIGDVDPPKLQYRFCADLELAKNYALPIVFSCQRQELMVNLIDRLVASTAGLGVCVEVVAKADPNATLGIQKFVYNKLYHKTSSSSIMGVSVLYPMVDLIGAGIGKDPKNETSTTGRGGRSGQNKIDSWSRELVKHAELKLASNLFTCKILIFGNSIQTVQATKKALPAAPTNRLKTFKTTKKPKQHPTTPLKAPTRYWVQNNVLCRLWWAIPLSILLFAGVLGFFNPLKLFSSGFSRVDLVLLGLAVFFAVCLFVAFRKRQPIVLGTQELAQIIGLPTAIAKLPITLGKVPVSRTQLGFEQATNEKEEEPKNEKQPFNKEDKVEAEDGLRQKITFPVSRHFPHPENESPFT